MAKDISAPALAAQQSEQNEPILLLEIYLDSDTLYYANYPTSVTFPSSGGAVYVPRSFEFADVVNTITTETNRVEISISNADAAMSALIKAEAFWEKPLIIRRVYADLLDDENDSEVVFWGLIGPIDGNAATFRIEALSGQAVFGQLFPTRLFAYPCPWVFGGSECGASLGTLTNQTADTGSTATVIKDAARQEATNDYWRSGRITFTSGALSGQSRTVVSSTTGLLGQGTITVLIPFSAAPAAGDKYTIIRGCDKTSTTCTNVFGNFINFGGFTGMPGLELAGDK